MKSQKLLFLFFSSFLFSQSTFNYERSWGTYFGAFNTDINSLYEPSSTELLIDAITNYPDAVNNPPDSYYNQFLVSSSNNFIPGSNKSENNFIGQFTSGGSLLLAEYSPYKNTYSEKKITAARDISGNKYDIESNLTQYPTLPFGVWLTNKITTDDAIIAKYDTNGNLAWRTYIPNHTTSKFLVKTDDNGNIYIVGSTLWQSLGDPGTYEPNFTSSFSMPNNYIIKLNSNGQKQWATYIPVKTIKDIDIYSGNIYIAASDDLDTSLAALSTSGTFQQTKATNSILKLNGNNGQRMWGTYYGATANTVDGNIVNIKVNSEGVFVLGNSSSVGGYFATEGAYKNQTTDGFDLFITKFSDSGARTWSTYLGSDGPELIIGKKNLDVKNEKIIVSGMTLGNQNITTSGAFLTTKPSTIGMDIFFSMFNTNGDHIFTSYYGGPLINAQGQNTNCAFSPNSDSFYLYGGTLRTTGYTTSNGNQQSIIYPPGNLSVGGGTGYIAKFNVKTNLSTSETNRSEDLKLFNNPNDGNFTLKGKILANEAFIINITEASGRLMYSKKTEKKYAQEFNLAEKLINGNYILSVSSINKKLIKSFKLIIQK